MDGLIGKKLGMTQVFDGQGRRVAVTVLEAGPCVVIQRKTAASDGYEAVQLGFGERAAGRTNRAAAGRFAKAGTTPKQVLCEFAVDAGEELAAGATVGVVAVFEGVAYVDVTATSKGRGFQGVMRRHHMAGGPMTHGSTSKRRIGAIGQRTWPARVMKGHRMPGHLGNVVVTQQNLRVVEIRGEQNLLFVQGAVPGPTGAIVEIRKALKKSGKAR